MNARKIVDIPVEDEDEDFDTEELFTAALTPAEAYEMAIDHPELRPQLERVIATDAEYSYTYAFHVLDKPFPAGEPAIATSAGYSLCYARYVLKKPFPAGEPAIATSAGYSLCYAKYVLKGPFPAGEAAIATDPDLAAIYDQKFGTNLALKKES